MQQGALELYMGKQGAPQLKHGACWCAGSSCFLKSPVYTVVKLDLLH